MRRCRGHAVAAVVCVALGIVSCGGGSPTLADYAEEVDAAVAEMRSRVIATDDALEQPVSSLGEMEGIWRERVAAREEFLGAMEAIDPPDEAAAMHAAAQDSLRQLADAEAAVGDQIRDYEELSQLNGLSATSAFRGFLEVNEEATNICLAAQGMFDDTKQREILADVPWITDEMKDVIEVVFGCVPGES